MKKEVVPINQISGFSSILLDYLSEKPELKPFYELQPQLNSFAKQIKAKAIFSQDSRNTLVKVPEEQYQGKANRPTIQLLADDRTFTVTTGHQLNLFTGPLYVIYKIVSTINLTRQLKVAYPNYHFVPVYWLASEDHDFEEINHFYWQGTKHEWQTKQKGAVGRYQVEDLAPLYQLFPETIQFFKDAYAQSKTLSEAVIRYMDHLFGSEGLICLDADHPALKQLFVPVMQKDILEQAHEKLVQQTSQQLQALGYKTQVNARPINLFYLADQLRERIEKTDDYDILQTNMRFSAAQMKAEIDSHPERFSPNVILRPLYQETILPNLAYIGGPAEVVYWLQLKAVFDLHRTPFPILLPRNFVMVLKGYQSKKLQKMGISPADLFGDLESLKKLVLTKFGSEAQELIAQQHAMEEIYQAIEAKASSIDATLIESVRAHLKHSKNVFRRIEKKLKKAELRNQSDWMEQIVRLKSALFPNDTWQERANLLDFYPHNPTFLKDLLHLLDPLAFEMNLLIEEDGTKA